MRKAAIAALAVWFIAGCSSINPGQGQHHDVDLQYVAAVEQLAKRYGTEVIWLNAPQKRQASTQ